MSTTVEIEALAAGAIILSAFFLAVIYLLRRMRLRRVSRGESPPTPALASDRAYNRLAIARREASVLEGQGVDVARARELIGLADRSFQSREFDRAFELAQSAHEALVQIRRQQGGTARVPARSPPPEPLPASVASPPAARAAAAAPPAPVQLPKNKLESQFQLHLFEKEAASRPAGASLDAARALYEQAAQAFGREEFTEALRLALRARRQLGGAVEALGPSGPAPSPRPAVGDGARGSEAIGAAEKAAASARCARCGHPLVAGDAFCRGCGSPQADLKCPNCGAVRTPADAFCGKCGTRYG